MPMMKYLMTDTEFSSPKPSRIQKALFLLGVFCLSLTVGWHTRCQLGKSKGECLGNGVYVGKGQRKKVYPVAGPSRGHSLARAGP